MDLDKNPQTGCLSEENRGNITLMNREEAGIYNVRVANQRCKVFIFSNSALLLEDNIT